MIWELNFRLFPEQNGVLTAVEIKSAATINSAFFDNLLYFQKQAASEQPIRSFLIYSGQESQERSAANVRGWLDLDEVF